jgi:hypothetical protein
VAKTHKGQAAGEESRRRPTARAVNHDSDDNSDDYSTGALTPASQTTTTSDSASSVTATTATTHIPAATAVPIEDITAYVSIVTPPRTVKAKPFISNGGVFNFTFTTSFNTFLALLSDAAAGDGRTVDLSALQTSKIEWKKEAPARDPLKPLSSPTAYSAMLKTLKVMKESKKELTIRVQMPPLQPMALNVRACLSWILCIYPLHSFEGQYYPGWHSSGGRTSCHPLR